MELGPCRFYGANEGVEDWQIDRCRKQLTENYCRADRIYGQKQTGMAGITGLL